LVARLSGDEFAIVLTGLVNAAEARTVAGRITKQFEDPFEMTGRTTSCTVSIGIAVCNASYRTIAEIIRDADTAMYSAKALGRSRCEFFNDGMRARVLERMALETDLRRALEQGEVQAYYQAKVRLSDEKICGFEALARWKHPIHGLVPPAKFIPIAEDMGLIHRLGMSILRQACSQIRRWQIEYPSIPLLAISVNLSPLQFREEDLVEQIEQVVRETGIPPSTLQLEVTESVLMDDDARALKVLKRLKDGGFGLKIDDFGTGYSSLSRLTNLPFDTLKIDRSFVLQLSGGEVNLEFVESILAMARALGMDVVAEGVEESAQADALKKLGCEFAQGYFYGKPVTSEDAQRLIENQVDSKG
jgi:predicted signal transduction protein with EAL and GGDEF domain